MHLTGGILFYALGIAAAPFIFDHELYRFAPFLLAVAALFCRRSRFFPVIFALFLLSFGLNQYFLATRPNPDNLAIFDSLDQKPVRVEGWVETVSDRPDNGLSLDLTRIRVWNDGTRQPISGKVRIYVETLTEPVVPGDAVALLTRLRVPRNFQTPGAFDYRRYLQRRNIVATGYTKSTSDIARIATSTTWHPVTAIKTWRHRVRNMVDSSLSEESAPFIKALAIGDRGAMTDKQRKILSESGIAHLFAISGLHIGLVAGLLYLVFRCIYLRFGLERLEIPPRRLLPPLLLPLLYSYMILTGTAISTVRALCMLVVATLLCTVSRRARPVDILLAAAFLILVFDPLALFEPAFQLSVAGAGGIILFSPWWQERTKKTPIFIRYPVVLLAVTLSASLATFPFVLLHFHTLAPAAPLLNLLAVPLVSLILVPLTLLALLVSLFSPATSVYIFETVAAILHPFLDLVEMVLSIDLLGARTIFLTPQTITAFILLALFAAVFRKLSVKMRGIMLASVIVIAFSTGFNTPGKGEMRVIALDVGQGDATLLQMPNGKNYLIDGGGLYSKTFDTGERLVAPALGHLGVDRLEAVILTHDHPDHRKGLPYILENFPVNSFWFSTTGTHHIAQLIEIARTNNILTRAFKPGWTQVDADEIINIYVPDNHSTRLNDHSLVLYARHDRDGLLMTGDLEETGIRELANNTSPGPVTLLKLPHHGSRKSAPTPLLHKYKPTHAFSSVGYRNRYGLPHETVTKTLEETSVLLHRTDRDGTISLSSKGTGWSITHWKKGLFR